MMYRAETPMLSLMLRAREPRSATATPRAFVVALCVFAGATGACRINTAPEPQETILDDSAGGAGGGDDDSRAGRAAKESTASGNEKATTDAKTQSARVDAGSDDPAEPSKEEDKEEPVDAGGGKSMADAGSGMQAAGKPAKAAMVVMPVAAGSGGMAASGVVPAGAVIRGAAGQFGNVSGAAGAVHAPPQPSAAGASAGQLDACSARLAACLQDAPLNYDGCLRSNQERGCPAPDAGTMPSTVLDENGNPISQVCQAELAKCIMMLPTPEHALECTEKARTCK
jgi:hypothetical protein